MNKPEYYRVKELKEIHITIQKRERYLSFKCGLGAADWVTTKCFRPNSLDSICRGCRNAW